MSFVHRVPFIASPSHSSKRALQWLSLMSVALLAVACGTSTTSNSSRSTGSEVQYSVTAAPTSAAPTTAATTVPPPTSSPPTTSPGPAHPPCDAATLAAAWNAAFRDDDKWDYRVDQPGCDGELAVGFITSTMPATIGNPDFGTAFFVARNGEWIPLGRHRTPDASPDAITAMGLTDEQTTRALVLVRRSQQG